MVRLGSGFLLALVLAAGAAHAQTRPFTPRLPCREIGALVARYGAITVDTSPRTYDRAVRDQAFCPIEQVTTPLWVPSADDPQCFIGYRCKDRFSEGRDIR